MKTEYKKIMSIFLKNIVLFMFGKTPFGTDIAERVERERSQANIIELRARVICIFYESIIITGVFFYKILRFFCWDEVVPSTHTKEVSIRSLLIL